MSCRPPQSDGLSTPLRVLIADDYPDLAESLAIFLSLSGCDSRVAHDGENALSIARAWKPHVCVLDLHMPKMDGWAVARAIRQQSWAERVLMIAITGWTNAADRHCAQQVGFDYFLRKPVDPERLLRITESALSPWRAHPAATDNVLGTTAWL